MIGDIIKIIAAAFIFSSACFSSNSISQIKACIQECCDLILFRNDIEEAEVYSVFPCAGERAKKNHWSFRGGFIIENNVQLCPIRIEVIFNKPEDVYCPQKSRPKNKV